MKTDPERADAASDAAGTSPPKSRARSVRAWAVEEVRRFIVLFVYLWVLFSLFVLNERIILHQRGIDFAPQGFAVFNAFILAKVMLVLEDLDLSRWLHKRPLIYPIVFESALFSAAFMIFHVLEEIVVGLFRSETVSASIPAVGGGGLAGLACVAIILFFSLIPFFAFKNFARALGSSQVRAMLFGGVKSH